MKTSKRIFLGLMTMAALAFILMPAMLFTSGCVSTSVVSTNTDGTVSTNIVTTLDINKATNAINKVVPNLVKLATVRYPAAKKYLADVSAAITVFAQGSDLSPEMLNLALSKTGVGFLQTDETQAVIDTITGLYSVFYGDAINAKIDARVPWLLPILKALAGSIDKGLILAG